MKRIYIIIGITLMLNYSISVAKGQVSKKDHKTPNIVIILADDMGFSDLGSYGGEIKTPNIDKLAHGGLRFTQFYNTTRCWVTRTSLMTGYYYQQVKSYYYKQVKGDPTWAKLLPQYLKSAGYRSYHSGKWHLQTVAPKPVGDGGFAHSYWNADFNRNFYPKKLYKDDKPLPPIQPNSGYYTTTAYTDHAIKFLKDHEANYKNRPFFLYLAYTVPHFPLQAPQKDIRRYENKYLVGWDTIRTRRWNRLSKMGITDNPLPPLDPKVTPYYLTTGVFDRLGPGEVAHAVPWRNLTKIQKEFQAKKMSIYAAMITRMDTEVGRIIKQLHSMHAYDNTVIFFLSDNGSDATIMTRGDGNNPQAVPGSGGSFLSLGPGWASVGDTPFRRYKMWLEEGGISTPLVVHWPDGIPDSADGELRHTQGHVIDFVPTILDLAGLKKSNFIEANKPPLPGKSLVPTFKKDSLLKRKYLYFNHAHRAALREGKWKLLSTPGRKKWKLYNIAIDRSEMYNIAKLKPKLVDSMVYRWRELTKKFRNESSQNQPKSGDGK